MYKKILAGVHKKYPIIIGKKSICKEFLPKAVKNNSKVMIITDFGVPKEIIESIDKILKKESKIVKIHKIAQGENSKSFAQFEKTQNKLARLRFDRTDCIIALGGGVVGDLAGYIASSYQRGIDFIQIPTTLLAQVDSSVGGKTAINLEHGKNLVGAFYNPKLVLVCSEFLKTLPKRQYYAGLAEVLKYGIISNKKIFHLFKNNLKKIDSRQQKIINELIFLSIKTKAKIVLEDEKEHGIRAILNYGHTYGHAIEALSNFKDILHGEAVLMGMHKATNMSYFAAELSWEERNAIEDIILSMIKKFNPNLLSKKYNLTKFKKSMMGDKKVKSGKLNLVLINSIGSAFVTDNFVEEDLDWSIEMQPGRKDFPKMKF